MIKLGNNDITLKIGSADVSAAYLGSVLVYTSTPPAPKWIATYDNGSVTSAVCGSSSAIVHNEIPVYINDNGFILLLSVEIGDCVTEIGGGEGAFSYGDSITSVTFGSGVTTIGSSAFYGCSSLSSITIPSGVTSIGDAAFQDCSSLTNVTIPSGVTSIGGQAFYECQGASAFTCLATTPPTIGSNVFTDTNNCPIYVPAASVDTYKAASGWSSYASRIQAIPTPSPQWVTFNSGDDISGLNVYGVKGVANNLSSTFASNFENIYFELSRNIVNAFIGDYNNPCYTDAYGINDNVELIFGNIGCSDYYTLPASGTASSTIQLYIYQ